MILPDPFVWAVGLFCGAVREFASNLPDELPPKWNLSDLASLLLFYRSPCSACGVWSY